MKTVKKSKTVTNKETGAKEKVEVEYRIDADFVPKSSMEVCAEFIESYCVANKETKWLVEEVSKTVTDKNGKVKDLPFVSLRSDFMKKFFPSAIAPKTKGSTFKDRILQKYSK